MTDPTNIGAVKRLADTTVELMFKSWQAQNEAIKIYAEHLKKKAKYKPLTGAKLHQFYRKLEELDDTVTIKAQADFDIDYTHRRQWYPYGYGHATYCNCPLHYNDIRNYMPYHGLDLGIYGTRYYESTIYTPRGYGG